MEGIDDDLCNSQPLSQHNAPGAEPVERKKRTRTGCLNCSRRRRKCDEAKPICTGCKRRGDDCQWRMLGSFREANIKVLGSDHPSMSQGANTNKNKRPSKFKILNALPNKRRTRGSSKRPYEAACDRLELEPHGSASGAAPKTAAIAETRSNDPLRPATEDSGSSSEVHQAPLTPSSRGAQANLLHHQSPSSCHHERSDEAANSSPSDELASPHHSTHQYDIQHNSVMDDTSSQVYANTGPGFLVDDLAALRGFTHHAQINASVTDSYYNGPSPLFDNSVFSDPADLTNDVFLPGSTYEALHTTLRNRQLWTARPDGPSRASSRGSYAHARTPTGFSDSDSLNRAEREPKTGRFFQLSIEREHILWQNYLTEICSWVGSQRLQFKTHLADSESSICLITIITLPLHSHRWRKPHLICDIPVWHYLRVNLKDSKMLDLNRKVYHSTKKRSTSYCRSWRAKPLLLLLLVLYCASSRC